MDSIGDVLKDVKPNEPPQIAALKKYVFDNHGVTITASSTTSGYIIVVPNASLASVLRMELPQIQSQCDLDRKLLIRIG